MSFSRPHRQSSKGIIGISMLIGLVLAALYLSHRITTAREAFERCNRPFASIVFLNGEWEGFDATYQMMAEKDLAATVTADPEILLTFSLESKNYQPLWDRLMDLQDQGWEIASGKYAYTDLSALSYPELQTALQDTRTTMESLDAQVSTIVALNENNNATVRVFTTRVFDATVTGTGGVNYFDILEPQKLKSFNTFEVSDPQQAVFLTDEVLNETERTKGWVILLFDHVNDPSVLESTIGNIQNRSTGFEILPVADVLGLHCEEMYDPTLELLRVIDPVYRHADSNQPLSDKLIEKTGQVAEDVIEKVG